MFGATNILEFSLLPKISASPPVKITLSGVNKAFMRCINDSISKIVPQKAPFCRAEVVSFPIGSSLYCLTGS